MYRTDSCDLHEHPHATDMLLLCNWKLQLCSTVNRTSSWFVCVYGDSEPTWKVKLSLRPANNYTLRSFIFLSDQWTANYGQRNGLRGRNFFPPINPVFSPIRTWQVIITMTTWQVIITMRTSTAKLFSPCVPDRFQVSSTPHFICFM